MLDLLFEEVAESWQHTTEKIKTLEGRQRKHLLDPGACCLPSLSLPLPTAFSPSGDTSHKKPLLSASDHSSVLGVAKRVHSKGMFACRITFQKVPACSPGVQGSFWQRQAVPESSWLLSASFWDCVQAMNSHKSHWCLHKNNVINHMTSGTYSSNFLHKTLFLWGLLFSHRPSMDCDRQGKGTPVTSKTWSF